jgi:glycosyltransferase involved in cell wall biosynthesis
MRILMVFHAAPYPPHLGPGRRHYHLLRELLKRHEVSVLSFGTPGQEQAFLLHFGNVCRHVCFVDHRAQRAFKVLAGFLLTLAGRSALRPAGSRKLRRALDRLIAHTGFDLVICSIPFISACALPAGIPVISDTHNVEWIVLRRCCGETPSLWRKAYYFLQARYTRREEIASASRVQAILTTSECDRAAFQACLPSQRIFVIPNGLDLRAYPASRIQPEPHTLLFTGLMSYYPNAHGIKWFLDEIFPRILAAVPQAQIVVAGAHPSRSLRRCVSRHVTVTGYVDDIRPYFTRAEVFVAPLRIGGGTRVKILEAMAMERPVVTTSIGCEGLDVLRGDSLLIGDTPEEFADAVVSLLRDQRLRESLASRGAALVRERYSWDKIGTELDRALYDVVRGRDNGRDLLKGLAGRNVGALSAVETSEPFGG